MCKMAATAMFAAPIDFGFRLGRRFVSERPMQASDVVYGVDEGADLASGVFESAIGLGVHLLDFEGFHEAFGFGVVVGVGGASEGDS